MDLRLRILGEDGMSSVFRDAKSAMRQVAQIALDITKESIDAYAKEERVIAQLRVVAGGLTETFINHANAIKQTLGVDAELVMQLQQMALRFGEAPADVDATTRAVLDYAQATGKDAASAMKELLIGAEAGTGKIGKLGITFEATGDKAEDFRRATKAVADVMGGAAAANAETFSGRLSILNQSIGDAKTAFGAMIVAFESKYSAIEKTAEVFRWIADSMAAPDLDDQIRSAAADKLKAQQTIAAFRSLSIENQSRWGRENPEAVASWFAKLKESSSILDSLKAKQAELLRPMPNASIVGTTKTATGDAAPAEKNAQRLKEAFADNKEALDERRKNLKEHFAQVEAAWAEDAKVEQKAIDEKLRAQKDANATLLREQQKANAAAESEAKRLAGALEAEAVEYERVGVQLGLSLASGIMRALKQIQDGKQITVSDVAGIILPIAGSIVGAVYGGAAGAQMGNEIGQLAAQGVGMVEAAVSGDKKHGGGWSGIPRYHRGAWVGADEEAAILQHGERVLSRAEVSRMGGPRHVDNVATGGGVNVTVNTFDGSTAREYFTRAGGRALQQAMRTNRSTTRGVFQ